MPTFRYTGVSEEGLERKGAVEAESLAAARKRLRAEGIFPATLSEGDARGFAASSSLLGREEFLPLATRQLATLVGAGVPIVAALQSVSAQIDDPEGRKTLAEVRESVRAGTTLARAIEAHPRAFPELYANMVRAGEESGSLPLALTRLADHLERQSRTRNRVRAALTYPLLMAAVASLVIVFLLTFVVPKIVGVFGSLGRSLPLPTRILIGVTDFLSVAWWILLILAAAAVFWTRRFLATPRGRRFRDTTALRLPAAGRIVHLDALSRFSRTLATMAAGGIPIDRALRIVAPVVGNSVIAERIEAAAGRVVEGAPLSESLRLHAEIPPSLVQMIAAGEESGKLDFLLDKMADAIDSEIETRLSRLLALLEPLIILTMGAVVAFIVIAVLLPLLQISEIVR